MNKTLLITLGVFAAVVAFAYAPQKVYACASTDNQTIRSLDDLLVEADTILMGRFVELDDIGANGIFQVQGYLLGEPGPEYVLLAMNDPIRVNQEMVGRRGEPCAATQPYQRGHSTVVFTNQQRDGSYRPAVDGVTYFVFSEPGSVVDVWLRAGANQEQNLNKYTFSLSQMTTYIRDRVGHELNRPAIDQFYPLKSPILLQTANKKQYLIPVDFSGPVALTEADAFHLRRDEYGCSEPPCAAYSPDGRYMINLLPPDYTGERSVAANRSTRSYAVEGDRVVFSPMSGWFALWRFNRIEIYMMNARSSESSSPVAFQAIDVDPASASYSAIWSSDGRILALSDSGGLWLWDVTQRNNLPRLVIPTSPTATDVPVIRHFSPQGHYLAVTEGSSCYTFSLTNGQRLPDGLVSPDDSLLLAFDTTSTNINTFKIHSLLPPWDQRQSPSFIETEQVQWLDANRYVHSGCGWGYYVDEVTYVDEPFCTAYEVWVGADNTGVAKSWGTAGTDYSGSFDYDAASDSMLRIIGPQQIAIDYHEIDLAGLIDGDIVSATWLPSLFHQDV